jgi:integrase
VSSRFSFFIASVNLLPFSRAASVAVTLSADRIVGDMLFLYTAKTNTPFYLPLPPIVIRALSMAPKTSSKYFFWTGESKPKSAVGDWQRSLKKLFRLAGVPGGHAHRFRDTFATRLLRAGVPLERVSVLLGHQSTRVTEKHYIHWVRERQEQLEADVRRSWEVPPMNGYGTPLAHATESCLVN